MMMDNRFGIMKGRPRPRRGGSRHGLSHHNCIIHVYILISLLLGGLHHQHLLVEAQEPTPFPTPYNESNTPAPTTTTSSSSSGLCLYAVSNSAELNYALGQVAVDTRACEVFFTTNADVEYTLDQTYTFMHGSVDINGDSLSFQPIIYAATDTRHFVVEGISLTISNAKLSGGKAGFTGGSIIAKDSATLTLTNVKLVDNQLTYDPIASEWSDAGEGACGGGALFASYSTLNLNTVTFANNSAPSWGGALKAVGSSITMSMVTFDSNSAYYAGALHLGQMSDFLITESIFQSNNATYKGGACVINRYSSLTNFTGVQFIDNWANEGGGALWIDAPYSNMEISYCLFQGNGALDYGGAIYLSASESRAPSLSSSLFTIDSSMFQSNSAGIAGGALYSLRYPVLMQYTVVDSNTALSGGAIYLDQIASGSSISSVFLSNNLCSESSGSGSGSSSSSSLDNIAGYGGAITVANGSQLTIEGTVFNRSQATWGAGLSLFNAAAAELISCYFIDNLASEGGGAIAVFNQSYLNTTSCYYQTNYAGLKGGALYLDSSVVLLVYETYSDNYATAGSDIYNKGSTVSCSCTSTSYSASGAECTYSNPNAYTGGPRSCGGYAYTSADLNSLLADWTMCSGTIYLMGSQTYYHLMQEYTLSNSAESLTIDATQSSNGYASIYAASGHRHFTVQYGIFSATSVYFTFGTASGSSEGGGSMIFYSASLTLVSCKFEYNSATWVASSSTDYVDSRGGGALLLQQTSSYIYNTMFSYNSAGSWGGAIKMQYGYLYCSSCTFNSNAAKSGGALHAYQSSASLSSSFSQNSASDDGGACWFSSEMSYLSLSSISIMQNTAGQRGGGFHFEALYWSLSISNIYASTNTANEGATIWLGKSSTTSMSGSEDNEPQLSLYYGSFYYGYASQAGGAIAAAGTLYVYSVTFYNNTASMGGAISLNGTSAYIYNSNFQQNKASSSSSYGYGGAIYTTASTVRSQSCTFGSNQAVMGAAVYAQEGSSVTMYSSSLQFNAASRSGAGYYVVDSTLNSSYETLSSNIATMDGNNFYFAGNDSHSKISYASFLWVSTSTNYDLYNEGPSSQVTCQTYYTWVNTYGLTCNYPSSVNYFTTTYTSSPTSISTTSACQHWVSTSDELNTALFSLTSQGSCYMGATIYFLDTNLTNKYYLTQEYYFQTSGTVVLNGSTAGSVSPIIYAATGSRHFYYTYVTFKAVNVTFTGGQATYNGGSIYAYNSWTYLTSVTFVNNSQTSLEGGEYNLGGGAVFVYYGSLTLYEDVIFEKCTAAYGGGIKSSWASVTSEGSSSFIDCSASEHGGAIHQYGGNLVVIGSDNLFQGCTAGVSGGAIALSSTGFNVFIYNTTFIDNKASTSGYGGSIWWSSPSGSIVIEECLFDSNEAGTGGSIQVGNNWGSAYLSLTNSNFSNNHARTGGGGSLHSQIPFSINNCLFEGSSAVNEGGAILLASVYSTTSSIQSSSFQNCSSTSYGGAIGLTSSSLSISSTSIQDCTALQGGAIGASSSQITSKHNSMVNNTATNSGGSIAVLTFSTLNSTLDSFSGNQATNGFGGALYIARTMNAIAYITSDSFLSNWASYDGVAFAASDIYSDYRNGVYTCTVLTANVSTDPYTTCASPYSTAPSPTPAPISLEPTPMPTSYTYTGSLRECTTYVSTSAELNAALAGWYYCTGTIYFTGSETNYILSQEYTFSNGNDQLWLDGSRSNAGIVTLTAATESRHFNLMSAYFNVNSIRFYGGTNAEEGGGSIKSYYGTLYILNCFFENNQATWQASSDSDNADMRGGGAILIIGSYTTIGSTTFTSNTCGSWGGAIKTYYAYFQSYSCTYSYNEAKSGGAVHIYGYNAYMSVNVFTSNSASYDGGAVWYYRYTTALSCSYCSFTSNTAARKGGAAFIDGLYYSTYWYYVSAHYNAAPYGGFLYLNPATTSTGAYFYLQYSTVSNNEASGAGGALAAFGQTSFQYSTLQYNIAPVGGAVYGESTYISSSGSSFIYNTATTKGGAFYLTKCDGSFSGGTISSNVAQIGAAIYTEVSSYTSSYYVTFSANQASMYGGALFVNQSGFYSYADFYQYNTAEKGGSHIYVAGSNPWGTITYASFYSNAGGRSDIYSEADISKVSCTTNTGTPVSNSTISCTTNSNTGSTTVTTQACTVYVYDSVTLNSALSSMTSGGSCSVGGTIYIESAGDYYLSQEYAIGTSGSVTLNASTAGAAPIIHASSGGRHLSYSSITFTAINLIFYGGEATYAGGSIYASASHTHLYSTIFINNKQAYTNAEGTSSGGGALFLSGGGLTMYNSVSFISNAADRGGALAVSNDASVTSMGNISFIDNSASISGGALVVFSGTLQFYGDEDTFVNNTAVLYGGGIAITYCSNSFFHNTTFKNNTASSGASKGGALYWEAPGNYLSIQECSFTHNKAGTGGGVYLGPKVNYGYVSIYSSNFTANEAKTGGGGSITSKMQMSVTSSNFEQDVAVGPGGSILVANTTDTTSINSCNFKQSMSTSSYGGGIGVYTAKVSINNAYFTKCQSATDGGSIGLFDSRLTTYYNTYDVNEASISGGAVAVLGGSNYNTSYDVFAANQAVNGHGEAVYIDGLHGSMTRITLGTFWTSSSSTSSSSTSTTATTTTETAAPSSSSNLARKLATASGTDYQIYSNSAGAVPYCSTSTANVTTANISCSTYTTSSQSYPTPAPSYYYYNNGGGYTASAYCNYVVSSSAAFNSALHNFTSSNGACYGGIIHFSSTGSKDYYLTQEYTFTSAYLTLNGTGAKPTIHAASQSRHFTIKYVSFTTYDITFTGGSPTDTFGGSIYCISCYLSLTSTSFTSNTHAPSTKTTSSEYTDGGGAILLFGGTSWFNTCTFRNNTSSSYGGAVKLTYGGFSCSNVFFQSNTASYGGAIYGYQGWLSFSGNTASTFRANKALYSGGGIYATSQVSFYVSNVQFIQNQAISSQGMGGGIYLPTTDSNSNYFYYCTFLANTGGSGGGIYIGPSTYASASSSFYYFNNRMNIYYSNFTRNVATSGDGGDLLSMTSLSIDGTMFNGGTALKSGGCLSLQKGSSYSSFRNSTVKNCVAGTWGGGLALNGSMVYLSSVVIESNTAGTSGGGMDLVASKVFEYGVNFTSNQAQSYGGGVAVLQGSSFNSSWDRYTSNRVNSGYGGGIFVSASSGSSVGIASGTFANETASHGGADLYTDMTNQGIRYCYINGQTTTIDTASTVTTCSYSNSGSSSNGGSSGYSGFTVNMNYISAGSTYVIYNVQTNVLGYLWGLAVKAPNTTVPWISTFKSQGSSVRTYSTNLTDYYVHIYGLQPTTTYYVYLYAEWDLGWSMPYTSIASYTMHNITTTASFSSSDPTVDIQSVTVGDTYAIYNLLTNAVGYMWTLAVQTPNTTVPWISTFKSQGEMLRLSSSNMTQYYVPIHNLKAVTSYYTYVYAEFDDGWSMPYTSIASYTRRNITTLASPTVSPSMSPTKLPTWMPTSLPTLVPSVTPTFIPTVDPTQSPSKSPTSRPTINPTRNPTQIPTMTPTLIPSSPPTLTPTQTPTVLPTTIPTVTPTLVPSQAPTVRPTVIPTNIPTIVPTTQPSQSPTRLPTRLPTQLPTTKPTRTPTTAPTKGPDQWPKVTIYSSGSTSTSSTITVNVGVDRAGYVWCMASSSSSSQTGSAIKAATSSVTVSSASNVSITSTGLTALTTYYISCYTEDSSKPANVLPDTDVALTKKSFTTACCYTLTMPSLPGNLYTSSVSSALTITSPITGVFVTISSKRYATLSQTACVSATASTFNALKPNSSSLTISPNALVSLNTSTSASFTIFATAGGCYRVTYALSGTKASQVSAPSNTTIYILTTESIPPAPILSTVKFSSTGSQLEMTFDSSTNLGGLTGSFACSTLVTFPGSSSAKCSWSSSLLLLATLGNTATVIPGNTALLLSGKIKASCSSTASLCSSYSTSAAKNVTISKPDSPLVPSLSTIYSSTQSSCAAMTVDASGTSGSGGRSMYYYWVVSSISGANTTLIDNHITSINPTDTTGTKYGISKLSIPAASIEPGVYKINVVVTNFLGSSSSSADMYIVVSADAIPTVSIDGAALRSVYTTSALSLNAKAAISTCSRAKKLSYLWVESSKTLHSTSTDPRYFKLSTYAMTPGKLYNFTIMVTDSLGQSNNATAQVSVLSSALSAAIYGGNRVVGKGTLTLDASYSSDPDLKTSQSTGLSYAWSCIRGGTIYGQSCDLTIDSIDKPSVDATSSGTYIFTVLVSKDTRTATASVTITVLSGSPPTVTITPLSSTKVSISSRLTITGTIVPNYAASYNATWSIVSGTLSTSSLATAVTTSLSVKTTAFSYKFPIVFAANTLVEKTTYTLQLAARQYDVTGYSTITFTTNGPPSPGSLVVSPSSGYALTTSFEFSAPSWADDAEDLPLYYSYYYIVGDDIPGAKEVSLLVNSQASTYENILLPQGSGTLGNITAVVYVADSYGAASRATYPIHVTTPQISVTDLQNKTEGLLSDALGSGQVDVIFQVVGAGAGILNDQQCDDPSNCQALRESFLGFIVNASSVQGSDQDSLGQQASALSSLTSIPAQLSDQAQTLALSLVTSIASSSAGVGITTTTATAVGDTISSLFETNVMSSGTSSSAISSGINDLSSALWVGVSPGEKAVEISSGSLKVSTEVNYATDLEGKSLKPPGSANQLSLPGSGLSNLYSVSDEDEISSAIISLPDVHHSTSLPANVSGASSSINSKVLRLSLGKRSSRRRRRLLADGSEEEEKETFFAPLEPRRQLAASEGSDYVTVVMESLTPLSTGNYTSDTRYITLTCDWDEFGVKTGQCTSGASFNLTCEGRRTSRIQACSVSTAAVCAYWTGNYWLTSCDVYAVTPTNTTCHCYNLTDALQASSDSRRLQTVGGASADLGLIVGTVGGSFISTLNTPLSAAVLAKNAVVFIAVGSFLGLTLLLVLYGYYQDEVDRKRRLKKNSAVYSGRPLSPGSIAPDTPRADNEGVGTPRAITASPRDGGVGDISKQRPPPLLELKVRDKSGTKTDLISPASPNGSFRNYNFSSDSSEEEHPPDTVEEEQEMERRNAEEEFQKTLPDFARFSSYWKLTFWELGKRHSWFSIVCVYSRKMSRSVRVAIIATSILTTMFLNAVLYDLGFPDSTPCSSYTSKTGCENEPSPYYKDKHNCVWNSEAQECAFNQPSNDFFTVILISVATTIISAPIMMISQKVFDTILVPPTKGLAPILTKTKREKDKKKKASQFDPWEVTRRRRRRKDRVHAEVEKVMAETLVVVQKRREELIEFINALQTKIFHDTAEARSPGRMVQGAALGGLNAYLKSFENKEDQEKLDELLKFQKRFEAKWHMNGRGRFIEDTWWERLTGKTFLNKLRKELTNEVLTAQAIEKQLFRLHSSRLRELRLIEYARLDFLTPKERAIYLRNKVDLDDMEEFSFDVEQWAKWLGWAFLALFNLGMGFYVCLFGIQKGATTTKAWLAAFLYSSGQDIFVTAPLIILWFYVYLPSHIRFKIHTRVDGADPDPFIFTDYLPPGPAARVLQKHPRWGAHILGIASPVGGGILSPKAERAAGDKFLERYRHHFRQAEKFSHSWFFFISFAIVTLFLTLPDGAQDMVAENGVPVIVGFIAWGFKVLYEIKNWFISLPISAVIIVLAVGTLVASATHTVMTLRRREAKPTGTMLTPMGALEAVSPTSGKRMSRVFVEGGGQEGTMVHSPTNNITSPSAIEISPHTNRPKNKSLRRMSSKELSAGTGSQKFAAGADDLKERAESRLRRSVRLEGEEEGQEERRRPSSSKRQSTGQSIASAAEIIKASNTGDMSHLFGTMEGAESAAASTHESSNKAKPKSKKKSIHRAEEGGGRGGGDGSAEEADDEQEGTPTSAASGTTPKKRASKARRSIRQDEDDVA